MQRRCAPMRRLLFAALATVPLAGCSASGSATDTACVAFGPIYPSRADVLTDGTARQILTHNITGRDLCGWNPRKES